MVVAVIDLFAGAGGLGVGAVMAGADIRLSVEHDALACDTLKANPGYHPAGTVLRADVGQLSGGEIRERVRLGSSDPVIFIGGPPCQPFSKAAYWTDSGADAKFRRARAKGEDAQRPEVILEAKFDDRRDLVQDYMRLVIESNADGFVFENVPSITHPRNKYIIPSLMERAESRGYRCVFFKANAAEFGCPQRRERVFIIGSKGNVPIPPIETHYLKNQQKQRELYAHSELLPAVSAGEALAGLEGDEFFEREEVVVGRWAEQLSKIPPGWNYKALSAWAGHPEPVFEAETRFWNFLLKLSPELPSWTIAASPGPWTGPFHWNNRRLRTLEMAALQSFPREYVFCGGRRERVRQIGNAVPPVLGCAVVKSLLNTLGFERGSKSAAA